MKLGHNFDRVGSLERRRCWTLPSGALLLFPGVTPAFAAAVACALRLCGLQQLSDSPHAGGTSPKLIKLIVDALERNVERNDMQERMTSSTVSGSPVLDLAPSCGNGGFGQTHMSNSHASVLPAGGQPAHAPHHEAHCVPRDKAASHIPASLHRAAGQVHEVQPRLLCHRPALHGPTRTGAGAGISHHMLTGSVMLPWRCWGWLGAGGVAPNPARGHTIVAHQVSRVIQAWLVVVLCACSVTRACCRHR